MKQTTQITWPKRRFAPWLAALAMATTASLGLAQEDYIIDTFSDANNFSWARWWGGATQSYDLDSLDADNSFISGSLKATIGFDYAAYGGDNQFAVLHSFPAVDGTKYTNLSFQLFWDSNSAKLADGNYGYLEYGFRNADWSQNMLGGRNITPADVGKWITVTAPIDPLAPKLVDVSGVLLKVWSGQAGGLTGTTTFWVDNVKLIANTNTAPPPPPSVTLAPAVAGLQLTAIAAGQQYQRQNIRTLDTDTNGAPTAYGWVGRPGTVSYAFDVKSFPGTAYSGYQAHMFIAPIASLPYGLGDSSKDWNAPNIVFFQLTANAQGAGVGRFMYKTNLPSGNTMLWNEQATNGPVGTLAIITDPSPLGTWTISFQNNTSVTVTTPTGSSTNFAMPAEAAALFADPVVVEFGVQPNQTANIGQAAVLGRARITGAATTLDDNFAGVQATPEDPKTLDPALWGTAAADASGIVLVPADSLYWLKWSLPDTGFNPQSSPSLVPANWTDMGLTNRLQMGVQRAALVPASKLPGTGTGFFRLMKP